MNEDYPPELIEKIAKEVQEIKMLTDFQRKEEWRERHWVDDQTYYTYKNNVWTAK